MTSTSVKTERAGEAVPPQPQAPRKRSKAVSRGSTGKAFFGSRGFRIVTLIILLIVVWQLLATYVITSRLIFTSPIEVAQYMVEAAQSGELWADVSASAIVFVIGYVSAAIIGIPAGLILGNNRRFREWIEPLLNGLYATPMLALAPILIALLGLGFIPKAIIVFLECIFPVIIGTMVGVTTTNKLLVEAGAVYGARGRRAMIYVYLPSSVPNIIAGLRLAVGRGIIGVIIAELFGSTVGLGNNIWFASQTLDMPSLYSSVIILASASIGGMAFLAWIQKKVAPWAVDEKKRR